MCLFQNQLFCIPKGIISGCNYPISRLQTFRNFVLLRILTPNT